MNFPSLEELLLIVPAFVIAIAVHEASHAFAATHLGDPTPRLQGRLTLNPLKHLDPLGSILLVLYGFGWGRPVLVNPSKFRGNPVTGMALVAFAGPLSNIVLAALFGTMFRLDMDLPREAVMLILTMVSINTILAVFNLLPLPPLDGFSILMGILPRPLAMSIAPLAQYGPAALMLLFFLPWVLKIDLLGPILHRPASLLFQLFAGI